MSGEQQAQRDDKGQWAFNNIGGPGNPFARQVAALRKTILNTVKPENMERITNRLMQMAEEGNLQAAKLLLAYAIGKPQPAPSPDRLDIDEWNIFRETGSMQQETPNLANTCSPDFYLDTVRVTRPCVSGLMRNKVADIFNETPEQREARKAKEAEEFERIMKSPAPPFDWPTPNGNSGKRAKGKKRRGKPSPNGKKPSPNGKPPSPNGDFISVVGEQRP